METQGVGEKRSGEEREGKGKRRGVVAALEIETRFGREGGRGCGAPHFFSASRVLNACILDWNSLSSWSRCWIQGTHTQKHAQKHAHKKQAHTHTHTQSKDIHTHTHTHQTHTKDPQRAAAACKG